MHAIVHVLPFGSSILLFLETERGIFDAILKGEIDFESAPWPTISSSAKDLIVKMLTMDPKKRITASEALRLCFMEIFINFI